MYIITLTKAIVLVLFLLLFFSINECGSFRSILDHFAANKNNNGDFVVRFPTTSTTSDTLVSSPSSSFEQILTHVQLPDSLLSGPSGLQYNINRGTSSFRSLLLQHEAKATPSSGIDIANFLLINDLGLSNAARGILLVCCGYGDIAHEVVLGVDNNNLDEAEYAATHPGQTNFSMKYPLSDVDRIVHSIIHRYCEGPMYGEGNYTGYDNAKYWIAGGPQKWYNPSSPTQQQHPIYTKLCHYAHSNTPLCVSLGVIITSNTTSPVEHTIIAGGGTYRTVVVGRPPSWIEANDDKISVFWDPFCFIDLIAAAADASNIDTVPWSKDGIIVQQVNKEELIKELVSLQQMELALLLHHELESLVGASSDDTRSSE